MEAQWISALAGWILPIYASLHRRRLLFWPPSLWSLHVTCRYDMPSESFISMVAKRLPLLEQLVLSGGLIEQASLAALVDHWPRLRLLHARGCHTKRAIGKTLRRRLEDRIKDLRLPHPARYLLSVRAVPYP
uniref:FBD domain-containing protein n=1 Tax=Aegilops tauschii TaxID=37682 RepID=M8BQ83_AEGTA